jgi:hypothetical protein
VNSEYISAIVQVTACMPAACMWAVEGHYGNIEAICRPYTEEAAAGAMLVLELQYDTVVLQHSLELQCDTVCCFAEFSISARAGSQRNT